MNSSPLCSLQRQMKSMASFDRISPKILLIFILLIGAGARLYHLSELSLGSDDLSVVTRIQVGSLAELFENSSGDRARPVGVQMLLWVWASLCGQEEWVLRIPFFLSGMLAIWLTYLLGTKMSTESGALLAATLMATTEYGIYHSLTLRPYIIDLMILLALAVQVLKFTVSEVRPDWKLMVSTAVLGAFCAYTHYFAALVAGVILLSTFMVLPRQNRKRYLISLLGMFVLCLPILFTFWNHRFSQGADWIGIPGQSFFLRLGGYLFHYTWWFLLTIGLIFIWRVVRGGMEKEKSQNRWLLLDWLALPFLLGLGYSWLISPIVHFGVLLFVYPFLLILIFSFTKEIPFAETSIQVVVLGLVALVSLYSGRGFYDWFYNQGAEFMVEEFRKDDTGQKGGWMELNDPYYFEYYDQGENRASDILGYQLPPVESLIAWADTTDAEEVALGWLNKDFNLAAVTALERFFPYRKTEKRWPISEYVELSKIPVKNSVPDWRILSLVQDQSWDINEVYIGTSEVVPYDYFTEFPEILAVSLDARIDSTGEGLPQLVMSIEVNGQPKFWRSSNMIQKPGMPNLYIADLVFRTRHLQALKNPRGLLKAYVWNPGSSSGEILRLEIKRRPGNPDLYAFVEDVR